MGRPIASLRIAVFPMFVLLAISAGDAFAFQIEPNPNPVGNTISITSTDAENLVGFFNEGTIDVNANAKLTDTGSVANRGTITVGTAGRYNQIQFPTAVTVVENSGTFTNAGRVDVGAGFANVFGTGEYRQLAGGTTQITGTFTNEGDVSNAGTMQINGEFHNPGVVSNAGALTPYIQVASGTTQIEGTFDNRSRVTNAGTMTVGATGEYVQTLAPFSGVSPATTVNTGTFTNNAGTVSIQGGTFANHGSVTNAGSFQVAALAQVTGNGSYVQNAAAAQTIVNGSFANNIALQQGLLAGTGTVTGAVVNTGGVVRAGGFAAPGMLTLASYAQRGTGRLDFRIGGLLAGSQYDVLKVNGPVTITGGSIHISLVNNFQPNVGDKFEILRGDRISIVLSESPSLPPLREGEFWRFTNLGNVFQLAVGQAQVSAPEPSRLLVMGLGLAWLILWQWKRRAVW
jgi:hypothetical protein